MELSTGSSINRSELGWAYYHAGRFEDALRQYGEVLGEFPLALAGVAEVHDVQGKHAEAIEGWKKVSNLDPEDQEMLLGLGYAYAAAGNRREAERILLRGGDLVRKGKFLSPLNVATIYTALGETDKAFEWLDRACDERDPYVIWLKVEPKLAPLRSDPRFAAIVRRVGVPS